jgi:hypothetical protein
VTKLTPRQVIESLADRLGLERPRLPRHPREIAAGMRTADAYLQEGARRALFPASQFADLYAACIDACDALVESFGFVAGRGDAGHERVLRGAQAVLAPLDEETAEAVARVRQWMRPLRHAGTYNNLDAVSAADLAEAQALATRIVTAARALVASELRLDEASMVWTARGAEDESA